MRGWALTVSAALLAALLCKGGEAVPDGAPPLPAAAPAGATHMDARGRQAAHFLASGARSGFFAAGDECYLVFLYWDALPDQIFDSAPRVAAWWLNQMSFQQLCGQVRDVPGTGGRLQWLDIRDFGWSPAAWGAVACREPYTREPWLSHEVGAYLRHAFHASPDLEGGTLPAVSLVRGDWLFRETVESDRSGSYYDLLYARQRFGGAAGWEYYSTTIQHGGGDFRIPAGTYDEDGTDISGQMHRNMAPGTYQLRKRRPAKAEGADRNFPATLQDLQKAFGVDLAASFAAGAKVQNVFGSVLEGGRDHPGRGSIVALNNRLVVISPALTGANRVALMTFDVFETAGEKDFVENVQKLPFKLEASDGKYKVAFDAGEALFGLPNGGQAGFLFDAQFKRVEVAANKAASAANIDPRLNAGVRNTGDCVLCHAPSGGFNQPANKARELVEAGVDLKFPDLPGLSGRDARNRFLGFYLAWEREAKTWRVPYAGLVAEATRLRPPPAAEWELARAGPAEALKALEARAAAAKADPGWNGQTLARNFQKLRDWYDDPVAPGQMARELGVPRELFARLAARSPGVRLSAAARGSEMPRRPWESDQFRQAGLLLDAFRREPKKQP